VIIEEEKIREFRYVACWELLEWIAEGWKVVCIRPLPTTILHYLVEREIFDSEIQEKEGS